MGRIGNIPVTGSLFGMRGAGSYLQYIASLRSKYGGVTWLTPASGSTMDAQNTALDVGRNILIDGDMEAVGTSAWTANNSALSKETTAPPEGSQFLRTTYSSSNFGVLQPNQCFADRTYKVTFKAKTSTAFSLAIYFGGGLVGTPSLITSWQDFQVSGVSDGAAAARLLFLRVGGAAGQSFDLDAIILTQLNIPANDSNMDADLTGITLGTTAPKLGNVMSFDGLNDYGNLYSAELNSFITPSTAGEVGVFGKAADAGVWTDNTRRVLCMYYVDANNYISIEKNTSNQLEWNYKAGGTLETVVLAVTPSDYFHAALKWNVSGYGMRAMYNGAQTGSDQSIAGTWVGNLASTGAVIGALNTTPASVWDGYLTTPYVLRDDPTDAEDRKVAQLAGVL